MPALEISETSAASRQLSEEASDSSLQPQHTSFHDDESSDADSDSLDSQASRKRRRVFPPRDEPLLPTTSVPSRVKTKPKAPQTPANNAATLAPTDPNTTFESLNVKPWLVRSLDAMAIRRPTGIQKGCIPEILKGRDCIGGSRTGSGKTVAFAVPILQEWAQDPFGIFALVITPTRYAISILTRVL